ncbi:MAG: hypothetical protein JW849_01755 [Phycisphaerae bacterium]|nr:hypothetical protein [Phycisphaerae bacterium]
MRGFRPSYFHVRSEDNADDFERAKQENVQRYMDRVREGLPIFEEEQVRGSGIAPVLGQ